MNFSHAGTVDLSALRRLAANDKYGLGLKGTSPQGRDYGKKVTDLTKSIAELQGFYIWGQYAQKGLWKTVYLGKAGFGRTASLRARIKEELKDERPLIWCGSHTGLDEDAVIALWYGSYPPHQGAINHVNRALRKKESTYIIWVATANIDNADVKIIEADLIETLNPWANVHRPTPRSDLQETTVEVIQHFKTEIHRHRG